MEALSQRLYAELGEVIDTFPRLPLTEVRYFRAMLVLQEQVMRASEDLLFIASTYHPYFAKHLGEESGHHGWIVDDLRAMDTKAEAQPQNYLVAQMTGMQYYHLSCGCSMAFFGYVAFLEGYPMAPASVKLLKDTFPRAMRTIAYHAEHDVEHRAELCARLDEIEPQHHDIIVENALQSAELYKQALWRIIAEER